MQIGVIGDTHGGVEGVERASSFLKRCDIILHTGDILAHGPKNPLPSKYDPLRLSSLLKSFPILAVCGNCDSEIDRDLLSLPLPPFLFLLLNKHRILVTHGHISLPFSLWRVDILIQGHTHTPLLKREKRVIHLNPGSLSLTLQKEKIPTFAIILKDKIKILTLEGKTLSTCLLKS